MAKPPPPRGANYSHDEDRHLCNVCIKVSQQPITSTISNLWAYITTTYNSTKPLTVVQNRNKRSLQSRLHVIQRAVSKLNECVKQVKCSEDQNSDASELDTLYRAKNLLYQDQEFKFGFKYDHVWNIMKDFDQFPPKKQRQHIDYCVDADAEQEARSPTSPPPPESSSALKTSDENVGGGSSNNSKKRSAEDDIGPEIVKALMEENEELGDLVTHFDLEKEKIEVQRRQIELEKQKIEHERWVEENKFMMMNLGTISDPRIREFLADEQERIMKKRKTSI